MSARREVSMGEELELCRAHLTIMGLRRDQSFRLRTRGVDLEAPVPPAIVHTLVENALSHNRYRMPEVTLELTEARAAGRRILTFSSPLGEDDGPSAPAAGTGTGRRYVETRLEERYPGDWSFEHGRSGDSWRAVIEIPAPATRSALLRKSRGRASGTRRSGLS
ncbi:MAG: hypothetical protein MI919_43300, partial [Holophagales bacterium]|nr:hypothetical protein [Holophagales bacterium]